MALALEEQWIWDFWLARDGAEWHVFYLKADKALGDPELRHRHATIGHAKTSDLRRWDDLGTCFGPVTGPAFDDWTVWTGSVIRDPVGFWHLFYTGTSHADRGMKQRIGHATSADLHNWARVGDGLALDLSGETYEDYLPGHWHDRAMRDPCVIRDPDSTGYLMFFTARVAGRDEPNAGGAIGLARSGNLYDWTLEEPVFAGGAFGQMEVPQVFEHQGRWYCLFSANARDYSEAYAQGVAGDPVSGTHYLMAAHPLGPWRVAPGRFLDGADPCRRYAGKILATEKGLTFMAFRCLDAKGRFVGALTGQMKVTVTEEGLLRLGR